MGSRSRRLQTWIERQPLPFAVGLLLVHLLLMVVVSRSLPVLKPAGFPDLAATLVNLSSLLFGLAVVGWLGWWQRAALTHFWPRRAGWTWFPLLLMPLSYLCWGVQGTATAWLSGILLFLALGVNEELINRGLIQGALLGRGLRWGVLGSALLFGLGHVVNGLFFGRDWLHTGAQMLSSVAYGIAVGAVRVQIGTLWPLALFHAVDDLLLRQGHVPAWWHLVLMFLNFGYGFWLLRRAEAEQRLSTPC